MADPSIPLDDGATIPPFGPGADLASGRVVLRGGEVEILYPRVAEEMAWEPAASGRRAPALVGEWGSVSRWHSRLPGLTIHRLCRPR